MENMDVEKENIKKKTESLLKAAQNNYLRTKTRIDLYV